MPRFTIGSLLAGAGLFLLLVLSWQMLAAGRLPMIRPVRGAPGDESPGGLVPSGPSPVAVDPASGRVMVGDESANDYDLEDGYDWTGGMNAATW